MAGKMFTIENDAGIIRAHEGFSAGVYASLTLASGFTYGVAVSGTTLIHCTDNVTNRHVAGWTASIAATFANAFANQRDIYWDGTNLQAGTINGGAGRCIKYSGITATVLASFADTTSDGHMKSSNQVAGAGNTQCSTGEITRQFQTYSGFTGTRVSSFNVAQLFGNHGGENDGTNYLGVWTLGDLQTYVGKLSGFTSTLLGVIVAPAVNTRGVAWSASAFDSTFISAVAGAAVCFVTGIAFLTPYLVAWVPTASGACSVLTPSGALGYVNLPAVADPALCAVYVISAMAATDGCSWYDLAGGSWYDPGAGGWLTLASGGWLTLASGGWLTLASGGWFDPRECP